MYQFKKIRTILIDEIKKAIKKKMILFLQHLWQKSNCKNEPLKLGYPIKFNAHLESVVVLITSDLIYKFESYVCIYIIIYGEFIGFCEVLLDFVMWGASSIIIFSYF